MVREYNWKGIDQAELASTGFDSIPFILRHGFCQSWISVCFSATQPGALLYMGQQGVSQLAAGNLFVLLLFVGRTSVDHPHDHFRIS